MNIVPIGNSKQPQQMKATIKYIDGTTEVVIYEDMGQTEAGFVFGKVDAREEFVIDTIIPITGSVKMLGLEKYVREAD